MKRKNHSHLPFATLTDRGLVRDHNEDNLSMTAFASVSELIPESLLCVLCDGVGGHQAGEIASRLAVEQISDTIEATDGSSPVAQLTLALQAASLAVWQQAQTSPDLLGMASTAACAWIIGKRLFIACAGDSRVYLIKRNHIYQISVDHTWLQEALDAGLISRADFKGHPNAHVIRRYLGSDNPPEVDTRLKFGENPAQNQQGMLLDAGDKVFLCSDGISDLISESELLAVLKQHHDPDTQLLQLKHMAFQRGAPDNLSMILVKIPSANPPATRKRQLIRLMVFALILLLAAFVGIYLGWMMLNQPG